MVPKNTKAWLIKLANTSDCVTRMFFLRLGCVAAGAGSFGAIVAAVIENYFAMMGCVLLGFIGLSGIVYGERDL